MDTRTISKCAGVCALLFGASCSVDDGGQRIDVAEANDLGVTTLQTEHVQDSGNQVFTLHAWSADDRELASVRLTIGYIPDIADWVPAPTEIASEIVTSVLGTESRAVTLETQRFELHSGGISNPAILQFLQLATVSSTLAREASIFVEAPADEQPYIGIIYPTESDNSCSPGLMLTTPVAQQCCDNWPYSKPNGETTYHVNPSNAVVVRVHNGYNGIGCRGSDGVTACNGDGCFFGPAGFARATVYPPPAGTPYAHISNNRSGANTYSCGYSFSATPVANVWANVTGTFSASQGCPGSDGGGGGAAWGY